jgi:hypothetical protein
LYNNSHRELLFLCLYGIIVVTTGLYSTTKTNMSLIKNYLYHIQEEEYEEYLKLCEENTELFKQLPKIIKEEV